MWHLPDMNWPPGQELCTSLIVRMGWGGFCTAWFLKKGCQVSLILNFRLDFVESTTWRHRWLRVTRIDLIEWKHMLMVKVCRLFFSNLARVIDRRIDYTLCLLSCFVEFTLDLLQPHEVIRYETLLICSIWDVFKVILTLEISYILQRIHRVYSRARRWGLHSHIDLLRLCNVFWI